MEFPVLHYKADRKSLAFIAAYYLMSIVGFIYFDYLYQEAFWTLLIPALVITTTLCFSVSVIIHNTVHVPMFKNKTHNKIMQYILSVAYGYSVSAYVPGHNFSHHKELGTAKDAMRPSKARFKWHLLNQLLFFFLATTDVLRYELKWANKMRQQKPEWYRQWLTETILVNVVRIGILFVHLPAALVFVWLPQFYALWSIIGVNFWQHDGCDFHHKYNHSRTFTGKVMNWFSFNNGFHGAHHDRPSLHWSVLPEFHYKNIEPYIHPNLSVPNMPLYFWKTYIYPGKRVNYDGSPYVMGEKVADEDWTEGILVGDTAHRYDFGAESISADELLDMNTAPEVAKEAVLQED